MFSKLVEDTTKKNILEEVNLLCIFIIATQLTTYQVNIFQPTNETQQWTCPFCDPESDVYTLSVPPKSQIQSLKEVQALIKTHVELHKADLSKRMSSKGELASYDKVKP